MSKLIIKTIEDKKVVWFQNSNSYLIFEPIVAEVLCKIDAGVSLKIIKNWCSNKIEAPEEILFEVLKKVYTIYKENNLLYKKEETITFTFKVPKIYTSEKYYLINNFIFKIQFENEVVLLKVHPIFAHLEIENQPKFDFNYTVFNYNKFIYLLKNNRSIGKWSQKDAHIFEGKLSMQLLIDSYKIPESNWVGVFHASAISNGKESMLFLGASGNGKSTSLALLTANGFNCIADDFVPIDNNLNVYTYPAAISIKKKSIKTLLPFYPELENTTEFHLKKSNKVVRYLPPKNIDFDLKLKCKALIFIKYNSEVDLEVKSISKIDAFQQLVPDSWISPLAENVNLFLDWFLSLPCYQLNYSNNTKMIETVAKLFNDEL